MIFYQADLKKETLWRAMVDAMSKAANVNMYSPENWPNPNRTYSRNIGIMYYLDTFLTFIRASQYRDTNE